VGQLAGRARAGATVLRCQAVLVRPAVNLRSARLIHRTVPIHRTVLVGLTVPG